MKRFIIILLIAISGLAPVLGQSFYKNINVTDADKMILENQGNDELIILDVRTPDEFSKGHIQGAINIDFWNQNFVDSISNHNINRTYLIYCTSGVRSNGAMNKMRKLGFVKLYNLKGGMFGWKAAKLPVISDARKSDR